MRRWSGLCFGLSALATSVGAVVCLLWLRHGAAYVHQTWPKNTTRDVEEILDLASAYALPWCVAGAVFAVIGLILWIREARAARRANASKAFE